MASMLLNLGGAMRSSDVVVMLLASAVVILACAQPKPQTIIVGPPPPVEVAFEAHGTAGPPGNAEAPPGEAPAPSGNGEVVVVQPGSKTKNQPPDIKLKLGHFIDRQHNIGLVIDRTGHEAKLRFDGSADVMKLDPMRSSGRTDYVKTINNTVLEVWDNGRVSVWVPGSKDSIDVVRDADADPL
jgi:hypothetical protein